MMEEVGVDDANKIRLRDLLRADQGDDHNRMVSTAPHSPLRSTIGIDVWEPLARICRPAPFQLWALALS